MKTVQSLIASSVLLTAASAAFGHGVQVQVIYDAALNKIVTRQIVHSQSPADPAVGFLSGATIAPAARVYVLPLIDADIAAGFGTYTRPSDQRDVLTGLVRWPSGPGLTFRYDYQTPGTGWDWSNATNAPTNPNLPNLAGSNFTYKLLGGLKQWNGSSLVDPGTEQLQVFRGDGTTPFIPGTTVNAITADDSDVSFPLAAISSTNRPAAVTTSIPHSSVSYRLLGDGTNPASPSDDGIYVLSLQLSSNALIPATGASINRSDPFYYVMYKGTTLSSAYDAALSLAATQGIPSGQVQAIPEPVFLALLPLAALPLMRRRRTA